jgi:hypothetical protein
MSRDLGPWKRVPRDRMTGMLAAATRAPGLRCYQREVADGHLSVLVGCETGNGWPQWHLSISHRTNENPPRPGRYPDWDEIKDARYRFVPGDVDMVMHLPPESEFVNVHETCFHLWQAS